MGARSSRDRGPDARVIPLPMPARVHDDWAGAISAWATALVAAGRTEQTVALRRYQLHRLAEHVAPRGPWDLGLEDLIGFVGRQGWSRSTRASYRAAVRSFYGWAVLTGRLDASPALALPPIGPVRPAPRPAPEDVYRRALVLADERVQLMLRLAADVGLRRGEVAQVHRRDLLRDLNGWSLVVHGKGARQRVIPLPDDLAHRLLELPDGWAFPGNDHGHLSPRWVGKLVSRMLPPGVGMHTLRHRFATRAYAIERDVLTVQQLLGHASPVTTTHYVLVDDDVRRRVVQAVSA